MYREALAIDPNFAEARRGLGTVYSNTGFADSALVEWRRVLETPGRLRSVIRRDLEATLRCNGDFGLWDEGLFRTGQSHNDAVRLFDFGYVDSALTLMMYNIRSSVGQVRRFDPEAPITRNRLQSNLAVYWAVNGGGDRLEELETLLDSLRVERTPWWQFKVSVGSAELDRADSLRSANPSFPPAVWHVWLDAARGRVHKSRAMAAVSSWTRDLFLDFPYGVAGPDTVRTLAGRGFYDVLDYAVHGVRAALAGDSLEVKRVLARFRARVRTLVRAARSRACHAAWRLARGGATAHAGRPQARPARLWTVRLVGRAPLVGTRRHLHESGPARLCDRAARGHRRAATSVGLLRRSLQARPTLRAGRPPRRDPGSLHHLPQHLYRS
jgi:hypothetical protein